MHEMGTIVYVIDTVEKLAKEHQLSVVGSVTLEVGEVCGIVPDYLKDFWNFARKRSEFLKATELKIEMLDAVTYCEDCEKTYPTVQYGKECPYCHGPNTYLLTGNEYNIKEIEAM